MLFAIISKNPHSSRFFSCPTSYIKYDVCPYKLLSSLKRVDFSVKEP